jgi:hypothetical protein
MAYKLYKDASSIPDRVADEPLNAGLTPPPKWQCPTLVEERISHQAFLRPGADLEQSKSIRSETATLVSRINEHRKDFFAHILAALDESRRRESARILRQYRHLIDDSDD